MNTAATLFAAAVTAALLLYRLPAAAAAGPTGSPPTDAAAAQQPFGLLCDTWFAMPADSGPAIATIRPPHADGRAAVDVVAVVAGQPIARRLWLTPDQSPSPQPTPTPTPPTPPTPTREPLTVMVIEESAERTPARAAILYSDAIREHLARNGWPCYIVDPNQAFPKGTPDEITAALAHSRGKPLPQLLLWGQRSKKLVWTGPMPEDEKAFLAPIDAHGGP